MSLTWKELFILILKMLSLFVVMHIAFGPPLDAGERFVVTERHEVTPSRSEPAPLVSIDPEVLKTVTDARRRHVIVYMAPFHCPPCDATKASFGDGDEDVEITYEPGSSAHFPITAYPTVYLPDVGKMYQRRMTLGELKAALKMYPPPKPVAAVTVGTIRGREAMEAVFQAFRDTGQNHVIQLGSAELVLPHQVTSTLSLSHGELAVEFSGDKPRVKYGSGWFSASRTIRGFVATNSLLTIRVDNCPDLAFVLE